MALKLFDFPGRACSSFAVLGDIARSRLFLGGVGRKTRSVVIEILSALSFLLSDTSLPLSFAQLLPPFCFFSVGKALSWRHACMRDDATNLDLGYGESRAIKLLQRPAYKPEHCRDGPYVRTGVSTA